MIPGDVKAWTDDQSDKRQPRGFEPLPPGLMGTRCPRCGSGKLSGAIITETADEADPNVICLECGYWYMSQTRKVG
jgi:uncharacterized protein (DUF983 family)